MRGKLLGGGSKKRVDYLLYFKPNLPIAAIEAKDNNRGPGDQIQTLTCTPPP